MLSIQRTLTGVALLALATTAVSQTVTVSVNGSRRAPGTIVPTEDATSYAMCFGDGTGAPCPSENLGAPGRGCENSLGAGGGHLFARGDACVSNDTLRLFVDSVPAPTTVILLQGTTPRNGGLPFGDGLRCLGGTLTRVGAQRAEYGRCVFPPPLAPPCTASISMVGGIPPRGGVRYYQVLYRDADPFGTRGTLNLTNAWTTTWIP